MLVAGNLVTPSWWSDLWLKEGFATYMGDTLAPATLHPERLMQENSLCKYQLKAFKLDSVPSTHAVRPKDQFNMDEILANYDSITYSKGCAIITMLAGYIGETGFMKGIRRYLTERQFSVGSAEDLWKSLERENPGLDVTTFANRWVETPGFPVLHVRVQDGFIHLSQERFGMHDAGTTGFSASW